MGHEALPPGTVKLLLPKAPNVITRKWRQAMVRVLSRVNRSNYRLVSAIQMQIVCLQVLATIDAGNGKDYITADFQYIVDLDSEYIWLHEWVKDTTHLVVNRSASGTVNTMAELITYLTDTCAVLIELLDIIIVHNAEGAYGEEYGPEYD
jgi:hypothetical protein